VESVHNVVENQMTAADMLTALISKETKHERD
jgi:glycerol-3-phosphate dehydrogenase (NAD(P)+)